MALLQAIPHRARGPFLAAALILLSPALAPADAGASATGASVTPALTQTTTTPTTSTSTAPRTVAAPSTSSSSGGISSTDTIGIIVVAGLLIAGIARIIMSDARRHSPAGEAPDPDRQRGSVRPIEHRVKSSRAKTRNARRARRARRAGR